MLSVQQDVERCLPLFVRLCINDSLVHSMTFQESASQLRSTFLQRMPGDVSRDLADHFDHVLAQLETIMGALSQRLSVRRLQEYVDRSSELRVAETVYQTLCATLKVTPLPFPKRS